MSEPEELIEDQPLIEESPTDRFNRLYITSSEVGKLLSIPRATIVSGKKTGRLPNPIEVPGISLTIWEREKLMPFINEWQKTLNKRRGLEK